jgi:hypothetical protein
MTSAQQVSCNIVPMSVVKKRSVLGTNTKFSSGHRRFSPGLSHSPEISNIRQNIGQYVVFSLTYLFLLSFQYLSFLCALPVCLVLKFRRHWIWKFFPRLSKFSVNSFYSVCSVSATAFLRKNVQIGFYSQIRPVKVMKELKNTPI